MRERTICKIIAISNQKGGVEKTTTTMNLGVGLCRAGKKVLLVDLDSQGNLTQNCGYLENNSLDLRIGHLFTQLINPETSMYGIDDIFY